MIKEEDDNYFKKTATLLAVNCVRNTVLENYHSEGKIDDSEICALNKEVVNKIYTFLKFTFDSNQTEQLNFEALMSLAFPHDWDEPVLDEEFVKSLSLFSKIKNQD